MSAVDYNNRLTELTRRVLELSLREALSLGSNYIGTEHLLLGLARENEGLAMRVLNALGVTADDIRTETVRQLTPKRKAEPLVGEVKVTLADDAERIARRVVELLQGESV